MKIKGVIQKSALGLAFVSNLCLAASFSVPSPYVQRTPPNGFFLNDLSFNSRGMYDYMAWDQAGKLGAKETLFIGGKVAVDAQAWDADTGYLDQNGAQLTNGSTAFVQNARLMLAGKISEATSFAYGYGFRQARNLFAFATVAPQGSNWMLSAGNMVMPFGNMNGAGGPYAFELTLAAYQVNQKGIMLAYQKDNVRASGTVFKPDASFQTTLSDFILDGEYDFGMASGLKLTVGGSYLNDIRGINAGVSGSTINGFLGRQYSTANANIYEGKIGAYDLRAQVSYNDFSVLGEYISNTKNSVVTDSKKGRISSVAVTYKGLKAFNMSHKIFGSWNHTDNMSTVALTPGSFDSVDAPVRNQWIAGISSYIYSNTKASIEAIYSESYNKKGYVNGTLDLSVYF